MSNHLLRLAAASLTVAGLLAASPLAAGAAVTELVSVDFAGGPANESSNPGAISADGRHVAFTSFASDLVPGDTNGSTNLFAGIDVFVRDRATGVTERVSVSSTGAEADNSSSSPAISADGRFVAFASGASNLVAGDTNGGTDVFVRDRRSGTTERVSLSSAGAQGNNESFAPALSGDGRFVAFTSTASNLVPGDVNGLLDVFVHDRQTGATEPVSVSSTGAQANGINEFPSVSADGRIVAFHSQASNLVARDTNGSDDVFVRDRAAGTTERVSVASDGAQGNDHSRVHQQALSADGRLVAFQSLASNLVPGDTNGQSGTPLAGQDIFVHDRARGATERVSVSSSGQQAVLSQSPSINAGGRYVVFDAHDSSFVPGDEQVGADLFVHDRQTGELELVNVSNLGERGGAGGPASISADGRFVAFSTLAPNLVAGDTNGHADIFVRDRAPAATGDRIRALIGTVAGLGLHHGTERSLTAKLEAALAALEDGDSATDPCGPLRAFGNHVRAQTGKKLSSAQATRLNGELSAVRASLGCAGGA